MTREQMQAEINRLKTENAAFRGAKSRSKKSIEFPGSYDDSSTYKIDATVYPKQKIVLRGERPNYDVLDESRGRGRHKVMPFIQTFNIGDQAVYDGYNFCYFGTITAIGPKTVTIAEHGDRKRRLNIERFAFWNRSDERFRHDERANWND